MLENTVSSLFYLRMFSEGVLHQSQLLAGWMALQWKCG